MNYYVFLREEPNEMQRRINQLIQVQQQREQVNEKILIYKNKMKAIFYKRAKDRVGFFIQVIQF